MKRRNPLAIVALCLCIGAATSLCTGCGTRMTELDPAQRVAIRSEAQKCADAMLRDDFETVVSYTYPLIVEKLGGKEKMLEILRNGTSALKAKGVSE